MAVNDELDLAGTRARPFPAAAQTHFIGVLASEELADTLRHCRSWMGETFGCRSGFTTPIHVTLIPPFALRNRDEVEALAQAIESAARSMEPFSARVSGFGDFGERTLFAQVIPDPRWVRLRDALFAEIARTLTGRIRKDERPFTPHLTVANRDIPLGAILQALEHFGAINLEETLPVNHIALFERRGKVWETAYVWEAGRDGSRPSA